MRRICIFTEVHAAIGDTLWLIALVGNIEDFYDLILCMYPERLLRTRRNSPRYKAFHKQLLSILPEKVKWIKNLDESQKMLEEGDVVLKTKCIGWIKDYGPWSGLTPWTTPTICPSLERTFRGLLQPKLEDLGRYVVIGTKTRNRIESWMLQKLELLIPHWLESYDTLIILGERDTIPNDIRVHKKERCCSLSIYPHLMTLIRDRDGIKDWSSSEALQFHPSFENFARDFSLIHHADLVFLPGFGGMTMMALCAAKHILLATPSDIDVQCKPFLQFTKSGRLILLNNK